MAEMEELSSQSGKILLEMERFECRAVEEDGSSGFGVGLGEGI